MSDVHFLSHGDFNHTMSVLTQQLQTSNCILYVLSPRMSLQKFSL